MLKQRLQSAAVIVPSLFLGFIYLPSSVMICVMIAVSTLMMFEFYRCLKLADIPAFKFVGAGCGIAVILAAYLGLIWKPGEDPASSLTRANEWENIAIAFTVIIIMVRQFPQKYNNKPLPTIACTLFGVLYIPFLMNFLVRLAFVNGGADWKTPLIGTPGFYM
ncbi:MAG: hypothetical protein WCN95_15345, partial [bacterium]